MKHYESVEFLSYFRMSSPLNKRKASLLKTFWRRFRGWQPFVFSKFKARFAGSYFTSFI